MQVSRTIYTEARLAYMRLFCGGIRGEHRFLVFDRADDLPWRDDADPATRAEAARLIRPLGLATDAAGYPRPHGAVLYGDTLFTCNFQLDADGTVHMTDDEQQMADLPVRTESFNGPLRFELQAQ